MARNVRKFRCTADAVFEVLENGWLFPSWVVGATRMRDVDVDWPRSGAQLHHSVGVWPALINDTTSSESFDPPRRMVMIARGWPLGEARVTIDVRPHGDGCLVRISEEATSGPAVLVPRPLADLVLRWRNAETLHRLAYLAEGLHPERADSTANKEDSATVDDAAAH